MLFEKGGGVIRLGIGDAFGSVGKNPLSRLVKPERLTGQDTLLVTGEGHSLGISQARVSSPGPHQPLHEVLERIAVLKQWVQHAMHVDRIEH